MIGVVASTADAGMRRARDSAGQQHAKTAWPLAAWTTFQQDSPDHLGSRYNVLPDHQMALITSSVAVGQLNFGEFGMAAQSFERAISIDPVRNTP